VPYLAVRRKVWEDDRGPVLDDIEAAAALPVVHEARPPGLLDRDPRCTNREEVAAGIEEAFAYDRVVIVEEGLDAVRELECGVIGNAGRGDPSGRDGARRHLLRLRGEVHRARRPACPAEVPEDVAAACMEYAAEAYRAIGCRGMARVDFFYVEGAGAVYVNEINTIPGFTPASMFPAVWAAEGRATRSWSTTCSSSPSSRRRRGPLRPLRAASARVLEVDDGAGERPVDALDGLDLRDDHLPELVDVVLASARTTTS
jgi:D-alanine-D-alanine ligase